MRKNLLQAAYILCNALWIAVMLGDAYFYGGEVLKPYKALITMSMMFAMICVCSRMDSSQIGKSRNKKSFYFLSTLKEVKVLAPIVLIANLFAVILQPINAPLSFPVLLLDMAVFIYFFVRPFKYAYLS